MVEAFNRAQALSRAHLPRFLCFPGGQISPFLDGVLEKGQTPSKKLDLKPRDRVRIKSRDAIVNVLMVIPKVGPLGGSEQSALLAASGLRRLGHRVYLMHAGDEAVPDFDGHLSTPAAFSAAYVDGRAVRRDIARIASFVAAHRIDVCHVQWIPRLGVYAWLARTLPLVHSIHVTPCPNGARYLWRDRQPCERRIGLGCVTTGYRSHGCGTLGNGQPIGLLAFTRAFTSDHRMRSLVRQADRIVVPSEWLAAYLQRHRIEDESIEIIEPPLAPLHDYVPPVVTSPPAVLFVGRLVDFKGADHVVRASALIQAEHRVVIVGGGPMETQLRSLASELGVANHVEFVGALGAAAAVPFRANSAVAVMPSLAPETYGMVGPEALAAGLPVVTYRVGGVAQWLESAGSMAACVDPGDVEALAAEIERFLTFPPNAEQRRATAERVRRSVAVERHAARLHETYERAAEVSKGKRLTHVR